MDGTTSIEGPGPPENDSMLCKRDFGGQSWDAPCFREAKLSRPARSHGLSSEARLFQKMLVAGGWGFEFSMYNLG